MIDRRTFGLIWGATYDQLIKADLPKDKYPEGWLIATLKKETSKDAMDLLKSVVRMKIKYQEKHLKDLIDEELVN